MAPTHVPLAVLLAFAVVASLLSVTHGWVYPPHGRYKEKPRGELDLASGFVEGTEDYSLSAKALAKLSFLMRYTNVPRIVDPLSMIAVCWPSLGRMAR